jgi:hypothetical protein
MTSPDFIIAGERRSGSTSLYDILRKHPEVGMFHKADFDYFIEPELFSLEQVDVNLQLKNWEETHSLSEYQSFFLDCKGVVGQKNADILWWKSSHSRIAAMLPNTKFVFVLRDPVKRAYSQYCNEVSKGRELSSFKDAIQREKNGNNSDWQKLHLSYINRGCYWKSLVDFFEHIPKERTMIISLEELSKNAEEVMTSLCSFLEINIKKGLQLDITHSNKERLLKRKSYTQIKEFSLFFDLWIRLSEAIIVRRYNDKFRRNKARKKLRGFFYEENRDKNVIDPNIAIELLEFYKPHNEKLEELFGVNTSYWK